MSKNQSLNVYMKQCHIYLTLKEKLIISMQENYHIIQKDSLNDLGMVNKI